MKRVVRQGREPDVEAFAGKAREEPIVIADEGQVPNARVTRQRVERRPPDGELGLRKGIEHALQRIAQHPPNAILLTARRIHETDPRPVARRCGIRHERPVDRSARHHHVLIERRQEVPQRRRVGANDAGVRETVEQRGAPLRLAQVIHARNFNRHVQEVVVDLVDERRVMLANVVDDPSRFRIDRVTQHHHGRALDRRSFDQALQRQVQIDRAGLMQAQQRFGDADDRGRKDEVRQDRQHARTTCAHDPSTSANSCGGRPV